MIYSILEQHVDGHWWYHPRYSADSLEKAEKIPSKWMLGTRPVCVVEHELPFPQESIHTLNMNEFCKIASMKPYVRIDCKVVKRLNAPSISDKVMSKEDIRADILARKAKAEHYIEKNNIPGREEELNYWRGQVDVLDSILRETIPL